MGIIMSGLSSLILTGRWDAPQERKLAVAKWYYLTLFALSTLAMWLFRDYGAQLLAQHMPAYKGSCTAAAQAAEEQAAQQWLAQQPASSPASSGILQQASMILDLPGTVLGGGGAGSSNPATPAAGSSGNSTMQDAMQAARDSVLHRCGGFETVSRLSLGAFCFFALHFVVGGCKEASWLGRVHACRARPRTGIAPSPADTSAIYIKMAAQR